eukprot:CAMPEP_0178907892 /NCGR_PEP_ID=MMETSP0786-20121207/7620_1 /TAXON_ID=186022 /ORGANISM="Thalassionema frauenfeldii, Strain CCMP 1798" /LENGTH=1259 /DNA_ID=CAMNT_0020579735 /DNA_START=115 /DNA_END=3894 /DNA_ORIENTATION=-
MPLLSLEEIQKTKVFVKTVDELEEYEQGYDVASKVDRRNAMRAMEDEMQQKWKDEKTFESSPDPSKESYFCNFPYPYMNGRLHLGHAFSLTKADFSAGYQMLQGKNVLFPFAFHCTGMPIQAAANKLKREIEELYGLEVLQSGELDDAWAALQAAKAAPKKEDDDEDDDDDEVPVNKAKGGKTKLLAKTGNVVGQRPKTQWEILQLCNVPDDEIPLFQDPQYWLQYFPPYGQTDLECFGVHVDWRRSFITTDTNPYYDSFVRWQFRILQQKGYIAFGKRPTVYSPLDQQACMDHDRASGEGKGPQEYTLIQMRVLEAGLETLAQRGIEGLSSSSSSSSEEEVYLVAATLRPETMYGQTNCFVLPEGQYGAYRMANGQIFVCSEHAALNLAHQCDGDANRTAVFGKVDLVTPISGQDLLGLPLKAPKTPYDVIYTLPLLTISMTKGTGVVTSVPSDAPDDYAALRDMQTKPELREQYGITEEMVAGYDPIPILRIPGGDEEMLDGLSDFGDMAAVTACQHLQVKDQHDAGKLKRIKKSVYNKGFYAGVMTVGSQAGKKVEDAKELVKTELMEAGEALRYWEPEEEIKSRSGDICVIAFIDQWFLTYGQEDWKQSIMAHVANEESFEAFGVRNEYLNTLEWLGNWACSRSFGLGTKVPWDPQFVVESLSDSTIYMAYYTVAHLLQDCINGNTQNAPIPTDDVWNYVFLEGPLPENSGFSDELLLQMRTEFQYWYPFNLRVSGKDLIRNHLTMSLYNHAAIWGPDKWPKAFYTNGHVMVDNAKMSKSAGNFISLYDAVRGNNVHLFVPVDKTKINKVGLVSSEEEEIATATTKKPHGLSEGQVISIAKSKHHNGNDITVLSILSDTQFTIPSTIGDQQVENSTAAVVESSVKNWKAHEWRSQSWTTDSVRYALACAGDSMNDANFESDNANTAILTLDNELEWIKSVLEDDTTLLREGNNNNNNNNRTIQDELFLLRMDDCIAQSSAFYEDMKFSMAMKFAFNDLRNHRKLYRDYHEKCGEPMQKEIVIQYIETLVVLIAPVMKHWSEYVWCHVLKKEGSVFTHGKWPSLSGMPKELLLQDKYLQDLVVNFRKTLAKKKKGKAAATTTSSSSKKRGVICVQSEYPAWKKATLEWLQSQWNDETNAFAVDLKTLKQAAKEHQQSSELLQTEKAYMGVVSFVMGQATQLGKIALSTELPFDETNLLTQSLAFLKASLELDELSICSSSSSSSSSSGEQQQQLPEGVDAADAAKAEPMKPVLCMY